MERAELKEQTQLSRTTADCKSGINQSLNFTDNRLLNASQMMLITNIQNKRLKVNNESTSQMVRNATSIAPVNDPPVSITIKGTSYDICEHGSVTVRPNQRPNYGSNTTGAATWKDILMDSGNSNSATRLHVVNANFGGIGTNAGGNLHPGSQSLNQHHKSQEGDFKSLLDDSSKDGSILEYDCSFSGMPTTINAGDVISDPTITVTISENGIAQAPKRVTPGNGMRCV